MPFFPFVEPKSFIHRYIDTRSLILVQPLNLIDFIDFFIAWRLWRKLQEAAAVHSASKSSASRYFVLKIQVLAYALRLVVAVVVVAW